ncbi:hypothetical protein E4K10_47595 [Streptomyces sp. T1317-0309]|nr:hypothetical protein E4K10_47595 [Streptomyces sp. T1317-0309]
MQDIADAGNLSNVTLGLRADDELDKYGWKKFDHATISMSTTYDHRPNKPSALVTSPATTCTSTVKATGDGDVTLYAKVSDPDGGTLSNTFTVTKTSGGTQIAKATISAASGKSTAYTLKKSVLEAAAGGSVLGVSWNVTSSDGTYASAVSATCKFQFDPSRPGAPVITDASSNDCGDDASTVTYQVGNAAGFTLAPNASGGTTAGYLYQLNGATLSPWPTPGPPPPRRHPHPRHERADRHCHLVRRQHRRHRQLHLLRRPRGHRQRRRHDRRRPSRPDRRGRTGGSVQRAVAGPRNLRRSTHPHRYRSGSGGHRCQSRRRPQRLGRHTGHHRSLQHRRRLQRRPGLQTRHRPRLGGLRQR